MGMTVICFHNNNEENGYLSNWYPSIFTHNGITFSSMEQYMMYRKALSFGDEKVATQILATDNAAEIKALGRLVSGYDDAYAQTREYIDWIEEDVAVKGQRVFGIICLNDPTKDLIEKVKADDQMRLFEYSISYSEII